jgi:hypothetical protein
MSVKSDHLLCIPIVGGVIAGVIIPLYGAFSAGGEEASKEYNVTYRTSRGNTFTRQENGAGFGAVIAIAGIAAVYFSYQLCLELLNYLLSTFAVWVIPVCTIGVFSVFATQRLGREPGLMKRFNSFLLWVAGLTALATPQLAASYHVYQNGDAIIFLLTYIPIAIFVFFGLTLPVALSIPFLLRYYWRTPSIQRFIFDPMHIVIAIAVLCSTHLYSPEFAAPYVEPFLPILNYALEKLTWLYNNTLR